MAEPAKELLEAQVMLNAARQIERKAFDRVVDLVDREADPVMIEVARASYEHASKAVDAIEARMTKMRKVAN